MNKKNIIKNGNLDSFVRFLLKKLKEPKPGQVAHEEMAPKLGNELFRKFKPDNTASDSAVLLLLTERANSIEILFTLRSQSLTNHSGQISFSGGKIEKNEPVTTAALRETFEETGIDSADIITIGELSTLYVPPSNSLIHPVIGYIDKHLINIKINPQEVEEAFFLPLTFLFDENNKQIEQWDFSGLKVNVPFWEIRKRTKLWGATAMILSEFLVISKSYFSENKI
jgi:8-oxo-dGTP pyrophosphatase MutT (NUDIX family)